LGYTHKHDLFFRDETFVTEKRVKRAKARSEQDSKATTVRSPSNSSSSTPSSTTIYIPRSLTEPLADLAVNVLFANLIFQPRHPGFSRGVLDFLPELYAQSPETSALSYATKATALAAFGNVAGQTKDTLSPLAWRTYGCALSELNAALADPLLARRNETLMTVVLFCLAESLLIPTSTKPTSSSPSPTISHIDGAVSLLKLRSSSLPSPSPLSTLLYLFIRTSTIIDRISRSLPLDPFFHSPVTGWQSPLPVPLSNPATLLTSYTLLVPALRARAAALLSQSRTQWNIFAVRTLLREVRSVDRLLSTWPETLPDSWQYTAVSRACWVASPTNTQIPEEYSHALYPGTQDEYQDIWLAAVWNSYRVARLFLNALVVRCAGWLRAGGDGNDENKEAECTIQELVDDVCSSVSFFLGGARGQLPRELRVEDLAPSNPISPHHATSAAMHGYFLLWPLFVCRSATSIPASQRGFLRNRMLEIAVRGGVQQARGLVELGDMEAGRPLYSKRWEKGGLERGWECNGGLVGSGL
jgi:hypothetical protein